MKLNHILPIAALALGASIGSAAPVEILSAERTYAQGVTADNSVTGSHYPVSGDGSVTSSDLGPSDHDLSHNATVLNASALAENYHTSDITTDGASLHASLSGFINVSASASPNGDDTATEASGYGYERTQIIFTLSDPSLVTFQASTTFSSSFGSVNYNVITLRNYLVNTNQGSIYDDGGATYARYGAAYDGFGNLTTYPSSGSISIELQPGSYIAEARASFGSFAQYNFDPGPHSDADSGSFSMLLDVAAVPEPSQYAAGISCLCALLAFQRRAKK